VKHILGAGAEARPSAEAFRACAPSAPSAFDRFRSPLRCRQPRRDLGEWLAPICSRLSETLLRSRDVRLYLVAEPVLLKDGPCRRIGMLLAMMIGEVARQAFQSRGGIILIELAGWRGEVMLCVSNNGDPAAATRGGGLMDLLAAKSGGRIDWRPGAHGSAALLRFPTGAD